MFCHQRNDHIAQPYKTTGKKYCHTRGTENHAMCMYLHSPNNALVLFLIRTLLKRHCS